MAHTKAKGSTKNNRDSQSKRLGVKRYGGETVKSGMIIIRQRGSKFYAGEGVGIAGDDSIYATRDGKVVFRERKVRGFDGGLKSKKFVNVTTG